MLGPHAHTVGEGERAANEYLRSFKLDRVDFDEGEPASSFAGYPSFLSVNEAG